MDRGRNINTNYTASLDCQYKKLPDIAGIRNKLSTTSSASSKSKIKKQSLGFYLSAILNSILANGVSCALGFGIANLLFLSALVAPVSFLSLGIAIFSGSFILSVSLALLDVIISNFYDFDLPSSASITCGYICVAPMIGSAITGIAILPLLACSLLGAATVYLIATLTGDDAIPELAAKTNHELNMSTTSI